MKKGLKKYLVVSFYEALNEYGSVKLSTDSKEDAENFATAWNNNSEHEKYYVCESISVNDN